MPQTRNTKDSRHLQHVWTIHTLAGWARCLRSHGEEGMKWRDSGCGKLVQSLDGISLPLKRAILSDQLFPWVMLCLTSVFLLSSPTFTELFTKMCSDVFGSKFTPGLLKRGIRVIQRPLFSFATTSLSYEFQSTLREYGGRELVSSVSNVAFVHVSHLEFWCIRFYRELFLPFLRKL